MDRKIIVYVAAPYIADTPEDIQANIDYAVNLTAQINDAGHGLIFAFCMHKLTDGLCQAMVTHKKPNDEYWYEASEAMIKLCDAAVFGGDFHKSVGCMREVHCAGIPPEYDNFYLAKMYELDNSIQKLADLIIKKWKLKNV